MKRCRLKSHCFLKRLYCKNSRKEEGAEKGKRGGGRGGRGERGRGREKEGEGGKGK